MSGCLFGPASVRIRVHANEVAISTSFVTNADSPGRVEGVALVTGGTGGLGQAVVAELLDAGAQVVSPWLVERERECDRAGPRRPRRAAPGRGQPARGRRRGRGGGGARSTARSARWSTWSAASPRAERLHEEPPETLEKMLALNLTTAVNASRAALPALIEGDGGAIVCVGAKTALEPFSGGAAYSISKAAVLALVQGARRRVPRGRRPGQRGPAERDRHARQPRVDARRRLRHLGAAGRDRPRDPLPLLAGLGADLGRLDPGLRPRLSAACCATATSGWSPARSVSARWGTGSRSSRSGCTSRR